LAAAARSSRVPRGQDGYYLVARLLAEGYEVHATARDPARSAELRALPAAESLTIHVLDLSDTRGYAALIADIQADELYNFAGQSSIAASFVSPGTTWRTNADAVQVMLEAVREHSPQTRFYQSSSTDMFGSTPGGAVIHTESSRLEPQSPYAAAKAAAHLLCDAYRRAFDLRIACGILANHESRRRRASFLTRKVVDHVTRLREVSAAGMPLGAALTVGNLAAQRDWGFAPDYVDGIVRVTRQISYRAETSGEPREPDVGSNYRDYVLGSGRLHAVWELIDRAFSLCGLPLEWDRTDPEPAGWSARLQSTGSPAVRVDPNLMRPSDPAAIGVDAGLARHELGWQPPAGLDRFLIDMLSGASNVTEV